MDPLTCPVMLIFEYPRSKHVLKLSRSVVPNQLHNTFPDYSIRHLSILQSVLKYKHTQCAHVELPAWSHAMIYFFIFWHRLVFWLRGKDSPICQDGAWS